MGGALGAILTEYTKIHSPLSFEVLDLT